VLPIRAAIAKQPEEIPKQRVPSNGVYSRVNDEAPNANGVVVVVVVARVNLE